MNTKYFLNLAAGNVFRSKETPAIPTKYYIGLSKTEPETAAGYARVELNSLGEPVDGLVTNQQAINFNESTNGWGTVTHFVVYDSNEAGAGNLLMYGALTTPRTVETATIMTIKENYLKLSVQNPTA